MSRWTTLTTGLHFQGKVIIGLAFDCVDKMVYWTDISQPSIGRASLHGGEPATIIRQGGQASIILGFAFSSPCGSWGREQSHAVYGCLQDMVIGDGLGSRAQTSPFLAFSE